MTKSEMMRQMIDTCILNTLKFRFVLMDNWFSSEENFDFIAGKGRHFIAALKVSRLVALTEDDRKNKSFVRLDELDFPEQTAVQGWLKGYAKESLLVRHIFTNKDGGTGVLHLVCSDLTCDYGAITTTYKKRWKVEVFQKSLKSNVNLAKSPIRSVRIKSKHIFMFICAAFKIECLSIKNKPIPLALSQAIHQRIAYRL
ncbi:transposase [Acidithiobacillus sp.]|uniref:transposase n=1 Tax=Acidithiobacillus sp. TaxID=1872118 RepID=UPI00260E4D0F|nr:transposase [Acidithiobacillus sp.]MDD5280467.1 transposase [Acidithiobacillus sp.]